MSALSSLIAERSSGVVIASEPTGLPVTITNPESAVAPINRNHTVAVLGCVKGGTELGGFITTTGGQREEFHRGANKEPGVFTVGGPAQTAIASANPTSPTTAEPDESSAAESSARATPSKSWLWRLVTLLGLVVVVLGFRTWRRSRTTRRR